LTTPNTRLGVEPLEVRDCPAVNLFNGVLTVEGTAGADVITVTQSGNTIYAGGQTFDAAAVSRIVITGGAGNDTITNNTGKLANLYGGFGNDTIRGGWGVDKIFGGQGADALYGGAGNDVLWGGSGSDTLDGGTGANTVSQGNPNAVRGNTAIESQIIQMVNAQRVLAGLRPLAVNLQLNMAAYLHTVDMVTISNLYGPYTGMQHVLYGTPRPEPTDRLDAVGYDNWTRSFAYGENIAFGYASAAAVMAAWMASPEHRANILNPTFTEIGVSVAMDAAGRLFFTQEFGYRS